jgi:hypothetical protein
MVMCTATAMCCKGCRDGSAHVAIRGLGRGGPKLPLR